MFKKFARAQILDVKSSPSRIRTASLSTFSDYNDYKTDDDYIYARVRAISSRVNKNHDGWPSRELKDAYSTFLNKPIFVDHHNHDPGRARGVIVDAQCYQEPDLSRASSLDPYYATAPEEHKPPTWIELLLEVDARQFPKLAKAVVNGDIDGVSMGCDVQYSKCSHCANIAHTPEEYCAHIRSKGSYFDQKLPNGQKISKKSYEDCYKISFFEISFVFDPADETALVRDIKTAKKASVVEAINWEGMNNAWDQNQTDEDDLLYEKAHDAFISALQTGMNTSSDDANLVRNAWQAARNAVDQIAPSRGEEFADRVSDEMAQHSGGDAPYTPTGVGPQTPGMVPAPGALPKEPLNNPLFSKTARPQAQLPQVDLPSMPDPVDTLRQQQLCPLCQSSMDDGKCEVCGFEQPPEGLDNPDLTKAQGVKQQLEQGQDVIPLPDASAQPQDSGQIPNTTMPTQSPVGMGAQSNTTTSGSNTTNVIFERTAAGPNNEGGRVNTQERPILPVARKVTDRPKNQKTLTDSLKPVESKKTGELKSMAENNKTADSHGVAALPDVGADARVNVTDVGGIAGVGVDGDGDVGDSSGRTVHQEVDTVGGEVLNDEPEHMEVDEVQRTDDSGPTKTWGDGGRQHAPVTPEASPKNSGITHKALQILGDPLADIKSVDVEAPLKQETGPPTSTWGKDEFHVRSDGGVTNEIGNLGGPIGENLPEASEATHGSPDTSGGNLGGPIGDNAADSGAAKHHAPVTKGTSVNTHIFKAFRVAETETALGIIDPDMKIDRAQELADSETPEQLDARLDTYSKVRTAGLRRTPRPTTRQASVMPSLQRFEIVAAAEAEIDEDATGIFY